MRRFIVPLAMLAAFIVPPLLMWRIRKREHKGTSAHIYRASCYYVLTNHFEVQRTVCPTVSDYL